MTPNSPESRSAVAADYVLGTLQGAARAALEQRVRHDVRLRDAVHRWERYFSRLLGGYAPVTPSGEVWSRLQVAALRSAPSDAARADEGDETAATRAPSLVAPRRGPTKNSAAATPRAPSRSAGRMPPRLTPTPDARPDGAAMLPNAPAPRPRAAARRSTTTRNTRAPWLKIWAVAATVLATVLGGLLAIERSGLPEGELSPPGAYVAALAADGGRWVVQATPDGRELLVVAEGTLTLPANRSAELWWIGADGTPVSMGVIPTSGRQVLTRDQSMPDDGAPTFAVSVEPTGGSPTGTPTGKVITTFPAIRSL
jgi:anti-sigma-K factor RskA